MVSLVRSNQRETRQYNMFSRRHMELLPDDVVEVILSCLPVKSMLRFKCVSKKWKSTIESQSFKQRQLVRRKLSRGPDVLFVQLYSPFAPPAVAQRIVFGSSLAYTFRLPTSAPSTIAICYNSCDGLVCLFNYGVPSTPNVLANPATRWYQTFPLSPLQKTLVHLTKKKQTAMVSIPDLGFGKDKFTGTYKAVWLYNSFGLTLKYYAATSCEVFDFSTNSWRHILPASPYPIIGVQAPVYFDGSIYWLTSCEKTKVLSFDLHTETFQVISIAPFPHAPNRCSVTLCVLNNRLCVSHLKLPTQVIWSLEEGTWKQMCCIDLTKTFEWFREEPDFVLFPVAILDKNKLLLRGRSDDEPVVIHDLDTKSCELLLLRNTTPLGCVSFSDSLLSVT